MTDGQAATFMQSYLTGWFALTQRITTTPGQRLLVLGAGGGVGLAAVDIGTALGLEVYAAASSPAKLELARAAGATVLLDSSSEDVKARARELSEGGVDLLYDPVGGELGEACLRGPRRRGHLPGDRVRRSASPCSGQPGPAAQPAGGGGRVGRVGHAEPGGNQELIDEVLTLVRDGRLNPVEPTTYPLEEAGRALADLAARRVAGKVALLP